MGYGPALTQTANIANGGTTSQALRVMGAILGIILPSALTSTTIAIHGCDTADGTFVPIYDANGNAVSLAAAASRAIGLSGDEADAVAPFSFIKLVCGSAEGAAREIKVCSR